MFYSDSCMEMLGNTLCFNDGRLMEWEI